MLPARGDYANPGRMEWRAPITSQVASPSVLQPLLARGLAAQPGNADLRIKRGHLLYDRKDYAAAAQDFAAVLGARPENLALRPVLARCLIYLGQFGEALSVLEPLAAPSVERGQAQLELGETGAAEHALRDVLSANPDDPAGCRLLCRILRRTGRSAETLALCEDLARRGATNAQFFFNWGWALAIHGDRERARRLMFDPARLTEVRLAAPEGFADTRAFCRAMADDILANPNRISRFADPTEANRGSSRVDNLFSNARPQLVETLIAMVQRAVEALPVETLPDFDPWPAARPRAARVRPWGLIQRDADYEEGHIHPSGWLSGVLYLRVPPEVTRDGDGPGCIEFGPPPAVAQALPGFAPVARYLPKVGRMLLSPSFFQHRTIPSRIDADRISLAFDVVPDAAPLTSA